MNPKGIVYSLEEVTGEETWTDLSSNPDSWYIVARADQVIVSELLSNINVDHNIYWNSDKVCVGENMV